MEDSKLKDVVLSTLAEMEVTDTTEKRESGRSEIDLSISHSSPTPEEIQSIKMDHKVEKDLFFKNSSNQQQPTQPKKSVGRDDVEFLKSIRERITVLFEGLKSEDTVYLETKLNLTLNFMETLIHSIDDRIKKV
jgi:hypothetical protein